MDKEILDTVADAHKYLEKLNILKNEISKAEDQIISSQEETKRNIISRFANLKQQICQTLDNREKELIAETQLTKHSGLQPLRKCSNQLDQYIESTEKLIKVGNELVDNKIFGTEGKLEEFYAKACGLGNLPEVPDLREVSYISFILPDESSKIVLEHCSEIGDIFSIAPIQLTSLTEKPGGILVKWDKTSEDDHNNMTLVKEFRLQKAFGDVTKDKNLAPCFEDCYIGTETQYLLKDIQVSQPYSFRICCRIENSEEWCPWSLIQVSQTNRKYLYWRKSEGFGFTNEYRFARRIDDTSRVLFSEKAQLLLDDCVEFSTIEVDSATESVVGLVLEENHNLDNLREYGKGSFLVDSNGRVFIDGLEKTTVLPKFEKNLKICFSMERTAKEGKVRVTVDCKGKAVAYDWSVLGYEKIRFACQMGSTKWTIMVE